MRRARDAGRFVRDLLQRGVAVEAGHDRACGAQQRAQLVGAPKGRGVHARAIERDGGLLRQPGEQSHLALVVRVHVVPGRGDHADERVLGHERHGEDGADALPADGVAQHIVANAIGGVARRLVLAPVGREERRAAECGGADGALTGLQREQMLDRHATARARHELLGAVELEDAAPLRAD